MVSMMMYVFLAVLGAAMGSFSGALVWRIKTKRDFVKSRSECEKCHHQLGVLDLVPVFSYLFLGGKCRYCRSRIDISIFLSELTSAIFFTLSYLWFPLGGVGVVVRDTILFVLWLIILVCFMILGLYDSKYKLLPNKVLFPVIALTGIYFLIFNFWATDVNLFNIVSEFALSLLPITGLYGLLYLIGERTGRHLVGFGDVKLGVAIAFLLSWEGSFMVLFLANIVGAIFSLVLIVTKHKKMHSLVPFGPFLLIATVLVFLLQINLENVMTFMYNTL